VVVDSKVAWAVDNVDVRGRGSRNRSRIRGQSGPPPSRASPATGTGCGRQQLVAVTEIVREATATLNLEQ